MEGTKEIEITEGISEKSRLAALLFGIFLWGIGVHNFYLGHTGKGLSKVLMIVFGLILYIAGIVNVATDAYYSYSIGSIATFLMLGFGILIMWIPGVWAFIEWILIACGKAKDAKDLPVTKWQ